VTASMSPIDLTRRWWCLFFTLDGGCR